MFQEKHQEDPMRIVGSEWELMFDEQRRYEVTWKDYYNEIHNCSPIGEACLLIKILQ